MRQKIEQFCSEFSAAPEEHSIVFTTEGKVYHLTGISGVVDPSIIGEDQLLGSVGGHSHPIRPGKTMGDSFSRQDLLFSARCKTGMQFLISGERRNAFAYTREFTEDEIYEAWNLAKQTLLEQAFNGELDIEWEQEEILKILNRQLEGFKFYENF